LVNEIELEEDDDVVNYNNNTGNFRSNYRGNQQNSRGRGGYQPPAQQDRRTQNNQNGANRGTPTIQGRGACRGGRNNQNNQSNRSLNNNDKSKDECKYCKKSGHS
jgi:hypothetical protein